ncbi:aminopeptidase P family protein [Chloroflexales bacterium ZM16-3]|nr:aminopeptidase P family protein [Chloroflexales bacterium ZM16-3]
MSHNRLTRLRAALGERGLPALLVSSPANRRYISGFSGSNGALLITADAALLFTDGRYVIQAGRESPDFELREIVNPDHPMADLLTEAATELGLRQVAFEAAHVSVAQHYEFARALFDTPVELEPAEGVVEALREVKDAEELATLRKAIAITDEAITAVIPQLRPEMTERQAAWMLEVAMRERGADGLSFPIIVAAGPNSALPHARPGNEPLGVGRPIIIDMGALVDGYHADLTRTVCLGEPDAQFHEIYNIVREAQGRVLAGLRPGLRCNAADALAREHIAAAGYGDKFGHGLGHGVGLDIHEGPSLRRAAPGKEQSGPRLHAGNVMSVEPGIYLEGWGGVRIEDLALITEDACEVLSKANK